MHIIFRLFLKKIGMKKKEKSGKLRLDCWATERETHCALSFYTCVLPAYSGGGNASAMSSSMFIFPHQCYAFHFPPSTFCW